MYKLVNLIGGINRLDYRYKGRLIKPRTPEARYYNLKNVTKNINLQNTTSCNQHVFKPYIRNMRYDNNQSFECKGICRFTTIQSFIPCKVLYIIRNI